MATEIQLHGFYSANSYPADLKDGSVVYFGGMFDIVYNGKWLGSHLALQDHFKALFTFSTHANIEGKNQFLKRYFVSITENGQTIINFRYDKTLSVDVAGDIKENNSQLKEIPHYGIF
jgi:hypothetical protein